MSFCILTLTISAGVPTKPPAAPAKPAIHTRVKKGMVSPPGAAVCLETYNKLLLIITKTSAKLKNLCYVYVSI